MKLIPLTQGKFATVDDEDYNFLIKYKWHAHKHRNTFYANRVIGFNRRLFGMHNQILEVNGIDHKNGNGLDNRRDNLRVASGIQNRWNSRPNNGKKYKGIGKVGENVWRARITIKYKLIHLGCFKSEEEAARAYDRKATEHFGQFARTNF